MKNLTSKEVNAVSKLRLKFTDGFDSLFENYTNGQVLDVIRYCKRLSLKSKKRDEVEYNKKNLCKTCVNQLCGHANEDFKYVTDCTSYIKPIKEKSSIASSESFRDFLNRIKSESFSDFLNRILDKYEEKEKEKAKRFKEIVNSNTTIVKTKSKSILIPDSKDPSGYSNEEINKILKDNNLNLEEFWPAFGICTCLITTKGEYRYYKCDVERALYKMGSKLGKDHLWD